MVSAILSKLDNPDDTRTTTVSVQDFLNTNLAHTKENIKKIERIKEDAAEIEEEAAKISSDTQSIPPDSFFHLPALRQRGALVWRSICRSFLTCIPKQRRSERRCGASITSTTNLCSSTLNSFSSRSKPVRLHELQNDFKLTK
jgi:hypothetical protein